ncbi:hypothetical protein BDZ97DRAFT_1665830 [Flammula alnicola]|nr:hypothetical protein BDZ97DRAFT_1665830 [Flammula alnicola]
MGRFDIAVEDNEPCTWVQDENGMVTHLLVVIFICCFWLACIFSCIYRSLSREKKDFILTFLGIDTELPYLEPPGLSSAFRKWKAIEGAIDQIINLRKNQEWKALVEEDPWYIIVPDFVDIFVSKSQFYQTWRPKFKRVERFSEMVDWLNGEEDRLSNEELWGPGPRKAITFLTLEDWLQTKEREATQKGKAKAVLGSPGKGKKHDDRDRAVEKRKHKKMSEKEKKEKEKARAKAKAKAKKAFSDIINTNFGSDVSLATVMTILFTLIENPDLLNLHFRQQHPQYSGENKIQHTGWMLSLVRALIAKLGKKRTSTLFEDDELYHEQDKFNILADKLDEMANSLKLSPYDAEGNYKGKLLPVSMEMIQPAHVICPPSFVCGTESCRPRSLVQHTKLRDIPTVTLIKGHTIFKNVPLLTGHCKECNTLYLADHERFEEPLSIPPQFKCVYLNSAKYIKIGQALWVDRLFSTSAVNAMYNFHASASAYAEYWNNTFGTESTSIGRPHIWQAFVQETLRTIAEESEIDIELDDALNIKEVTSQAFAILGENGIIRAADQHTCSECTQKYKTSSDATFNDPAAVVGVDQNDDAIPGLAADIPENNQEIPLPDSDDGMDIDNRWVTMNVLDGVVMGPQHCAFDNCLNDLSNARGGSLCDLHHVQLATRCLMRTCTNQRLEGTNACQTHQPEWQKFKKYNSRQVQSGVRRMLQRPSEILDWQPRRRGPNPQRHDDPSADPPLPKNYFSPGRYYCVETICAPCGVVIAWTKFARAESTTNILNFLGSVYPTEESRPDYICIDKGCQVFATAVTNGSWEVWKKTTRFIVDSYHYINHRVTDYLCRKYCNPSPGDGSAPNLVIIAFDKNGQPYAQRAFNTQACEQLNAWLAGFQSILKRMTPGNFNWFLHAMLFYHTKYVLRKQKLKQQRQTNNEEADENLGLDEEIEEDDEE